MLILKDGPQERRETCVLFSQLCNMYVLAPSTPVIYYLGAYFVFRFCICSRSKFGNLAGVVLSGHGNCYECSLLFELAIIFRNVMMKKTQDLKQPPTRK